MHYTIRSVVSGFTTGFSLSFFFAGREFFAAKGPSLLVVKPTIFFDVATVGRYDYLGGSKLLSSLDLFHLLTRAGQRVVSP